MPELFTTFTQTTKRSRIPYGELPEYNTVFRAGVAQETTRRLVCKWYDRWSFQKDLLMGLSVGIPLSNTVIVSKYGASLSTAANRLPLNRLDPEAHPKYAHLYAAHTQEIRGMGGPAPDPATGALYFYSGPNRAGQGGVTQSDQGYAEIHVVYKPLPYTLTPQSPSESTINTVNAPNANQVGNPGSAAQAAIVTEACRYVSVKPNGSVKKLPLPNSIFAQAIDLGDGNGYAVIPEPGTLDLPLVHLAYTWYAVPLVPKFAFDAMACVNCNYFDITPRQIPLAMATNFFPGTILYHHPEISDWYPLSDGTKVVDIVYHFTYNPYGWNRIYSPARGGFVPVFRIGGVGKKVIEIIGQLPHLSVNLNQGQPPNLLAPSLDSPYFRFSPGFNVYDWIDLNLLFCLLQ